MMLCCFPSSPRLSKPSPAGHRGSPGLDGKCGPSSVSWFCLVVFPQTDVPGRRLLNYCLMEDLEESLCLTLSQLSSGEGLLGCPEAQLSANHAGCGDVPQVVAHGAPLPLPQHLNTTRAEPRPRLQAHNRLQNKHNTALHPRSEVPLW